jgi:diguanylate cyclase (GGDEF)-like protein
MILCYANAKFCDLIGKNNDEILGKPFSKLMPENDGSLLLIEQVFRNGECETHTIQVHAEPHPYFWAYEIWPIWNETPSNGGPVGLVFQVTETVPLHQRTAVMNEALLLSSVRQHEWIEETEELNKKLTAEIMERKRVEREIEQLAFYDPLTDLPNRRLLMDRLHHAILASCRTMNHGAIFFIDLDHFKNVNDTQGHHLGDVLLQQVAQRLRDCVREDDTVARLGGDEFVVMVQELSDNLRSATLQAKNLGGKILLALNQPYLLAGHDHHCSGSIGITLFGKKREPVSELLKRADMAQYRAKTAGGGSVRFFDPEMQAKADSRRLLEADLRQAVQDDQFRLHYQSQIDDLGCLKGFEALLRWQHPKRGLLLPSEFIVCAEEHGIIEAIGLWVLTTACAQLAIWSLKPETASLTLAINVSAREFGSPDFVSKVLGIVVATGVDPSKLILEFTERVMFGPLEETRATMLALKSCGLSFALDDFGIGFSSLTCLKSLPVSQVKIDRSFVRDVLTSHSDGVIASAIIALGHNLGLTVIAEGIETEEQHRFLMKHGCRMYQGFFFGQPLPIEQLNSDN